MREPDWALRGDLEWGTGHRAVRSGATRFGDQPFLVGSDRILTYAGLAAAVDTAAASFLARGVRAGNRVAVWLPNGPEWIVAALGAQAIGAVLVPVNTRYRGAEAAYVLRRARATVLVTTSAFLDIDHVELIRAAEVDHGRLEDLQTIVDVRGGRHPDTISWEDFLHLAGTVDAGDLHRATDAVRPSDPADVMFTSGTTGHPKGVVCSHAQNLRVYRDWAEITGLRAGDRYLAVNPFFHGFGYKAGWFAALLVGATVYPVPVFDVEQVFDAIEREGITVFPGPPTMYFAMLDHPRRADTDLATLRLAVTGASVVPVELVRRMHDDLGFETVLTGYGQTESCGTITMARREDDIETVAHTSGRPIPGVEVIVADHDGEPVVGMPGEVWTRGHNVMLGYDDDLTATRDVVGGDGWLRTGDVGVMDDHGYLAITDRMKDMFIVGGLNAYPAEIEHLLLLHPAIAQVAVIGVPDDHLGEVPMAFVILTPDADPDDHGIVEWARESIANFKVPRSVEVVDAFPLNATGKVLKDELRAWAAGVRSTRSADGGPGGDR